MNGKALQIQLTYNGQGLPHGNFQSARLRLPFGQGIWPAFWMLGTDIGESGWPSCGEIDIMENWGTSRAGMRPACTAPATVETAR